MFAVEYVFEGRAGDVVSIEMTGTSGDLDTYLSLRDAAGFEIIANDDFEPGSTLDSRIERFELPQDGSYTIVATRFNQQSGTSSGDFNLSLVRDDATPPTPVAPPDGGQLRYGDAIEGTISDAEFAVEFTFEGRAGDIVQITMEATSGDLDPFLSLVDPRGFEIVVNDDAASGANLDSEIADFALPEDGIYTIVATRFSQELGSSSGDFILRLQSDSADVQVPPPPPGNVLTYGVTVIGEITADDSVDEYTFEGRDGDTIGVQMSRISGDLDTLVALLDPAGQEIANNDDDPQGTNVDSYLRDFTLPADGVYTIVATRFNREFGTSSGRYELRLESAGGSQASPIGQVAGLLELGVPLTGRITLENFLQVYRFRGEMGTTITFTMDRASGDLDPYLILLDPSGREIARNDDRVSGDLNATLDNIRLPLSGEYSLVAGRFNRTFGDSAGEFVLEAFETSGQTLVADLVEPIRLDTRVQGSISEDSPARYYAFPARRGDVFTIELVSPNGAIDSLLILEDSLGREIARNDDDQLDGSLFDRDSRLHEYVLPRDGFYTLTATSFDGTGPFELEIARLGGARPGEPVPIYAPINVSWSRGILSDDSGYIYYGAGDWANDEIESPMYSIVTYHLPQLPGDRPVREAVLRLDLCHFEGADAFATFGAVRVALNARFSTIQEIDQALDPVAPVVTEIGQCEPVNVTEIVQAAYAEGQSILQFRFEFRNNDALVNGAVDAVIFADPRLQIVFE